MVLRMVMLSATALTSLAISAPAFAQDTQADAGSGKLQELVVTARRRTENLQDVPIAVTAITGSQIDVKGVSDIADVAKLTPSLVFDKFFSPQDSRPVIRGLPATRGRPPVGILVDGIDITTESLATAGGGNLMDLRLVDFDHIEVVKGPQSALYGRAAFGGAINYITKDPGKTYGGYVSAEVGTYGKYDARGAVDLPVNDTLSFRVNGNYSYFNGFYKNSVTDKYVGGWQDGGVALSFRWQPTAQLKFLGRISYANANDEQSAQTYYGVNNGLAVNLPLPAAAVGVAMGTPATVLPNFVTGYRFGDIDRAPGVNVALSADPAHPSDDYPGAQTDTIIGSLRGEYDMGYLTISSWTGFTDQNGQTVSDVDLFGRPLTQVALPAPGGLGEYSGRTLGNGLWQFDISTRLRQVSQELRISHLDGGRFRWAFGGLYWHEQVDQPNRTVTIFSLANGSPWLDLAQQGGRSPVASQTARTTDHYSLYGIAEYDITSQLELSAEVRVAQERLSYLFGQNVSVASTSPTAGAVPLILTGSSSSAASITKYATPRVILNYKPWERIMFYASAAEGIKPGGFTQVGTANPDLGKYNPEKVWNYEIGAKTTLFDRRLRLNAAAFHMDYTDKQETALITVPLSVSPQGALTVTNNIGAAVVNGVEMDFTAVLTPEITMSGGWTHLKTEYTNYVFDSSTPLTIIRTRVCQVITISNGKTCQLNLTGNELEAAPRDVMQLEFDYRHPISHDLTLTADVEGNYRSKRYLEDTNSWILRPFGLMNLKVGIETDKWSLIGYVDNVLDDKTIESAETINDNASGVSGQVIIAPFLPDPRQFGLRFKYSF